MESLVAGLDQLLRTTPNEDIKLLKDCLASAASDKASSSSSAAAAKAPKTSSVHAARTGLLLHKRFTNLPIQLVGALHRNLEEDVSWAQQQATDDDEEVVESTSSSGQKASKSNQGGNFFAEARNVVLFCECAVSKEGKSAYTLGEGNTCYNVLGSCSDIIFACFEDEVYLQHATAAVLFRPAKTLCTTDLVALLVPISKLKKCANGICELIPE
jgi:hypothetical protein